MRANPMSILAGVLVWTAALGTVGFAGEPIPLDQAVREGKVWVHVSSLGGSTGNAINVNVKRMVNEEVRVTVAPGTVLVPGSDVQRMAAASVQGEYVGGKWRKADTIVLSDDRQRDFMLEAYCIDYDKPAPRHGDVFTLNVRNDEVKKVLDVGARKAATAVDVQVAIWMDRQRAKGVEVNVGELKERFPVATDKNIAAARNLLVDVRTNQAAGSTSTTVQAGRVLGVPGVDVQVDTSRDRRKVKVGASGFSVNVDVPTPPRGPSAESRQPPQVLSVHKADQYVVASRSARSTGGTPYSATEDKTFLIISVAIASEAKDVATDKFSIQVDGKSIPAKLASMGSAVFAPDAPPRLPSPHRTHSFGSVLGPIVTGTIRYQLVFEVPKQTAQGTLRWAETAEVSWATADVGSR